MRFLEAEEGNPVRIYKLGDLAATGNSRKRPIEGFAIVQSIRLWGYLWPVMFRFDAWCLTTISADRTYRGSARKAYRSVGSVGSVGMESTNTGQSMLLPVAVP